MKNFQFIKFLIIADIKSPVLAFNSINFQNGLHQNISYHIFSIAICWIEIELQGKLEEIAFQIVSGLHMC